MGGGPGGAATTGRAVDGGKPTDGGKGDGTGEPPGPGAAGPDGRGAGGAGGLWYWKTFFRPISSFEPSDFSMRSSRIRASVGAGGFADVFVSGTCTASVVDGPVIRYPRTAVMPKTIRSTIRILSFWRSCLLIGKKTSRDSIPAKSPTIPNPCRGDRSS